MLKISQTSMFKSQFSNKRVTQNYKVSHFIILFPLQIKHSLRELREAET